MMRKRVNARISLSIPLIRDDGVESAQIDFEHGLLQLRYDPSQISAHAVDDIADELGIKLGKRSNHCTMGLDGVGCRDCPLRLERELAAIPGVHHVSANPAAHVVGVHYKDDETLRAVERSISEMGYEVTERNAEAKPPFWGTQPRSCLGGINLPVHGVRIVVPIPRSDLKYALVVDRFLCARLCGGWT